MLEKEGLNVANALSESTHDAVRAAVGDNVTEKLPPSLIDNVGDDEADAHREAGALDEGSIEAVPATVGVADEEKEGEFVASAVKEAHADMLGLPLNEAHGEVEYCELWETDALSDANPVTEGITVLDSHELTVEVCETLAFTLGDTAGEADCSGLFEGDALNEDATEADGALVRDAKSDIEGCTDAEALPVEDCEGLALIHSDTAAVGVGSGLEDDKTLGDKGAVSVANIENELQGDGEYTPDADSVPKEESEGSGL